MSERPNRPLPPEVGPWLDSLCAELGVERAAVDEELLLEVTRDVAHGVSRPAAPLTAYVLGLAAASGTDPASAAGRVAALARDWTPPSRPA